MEAKEGGSSGGGGLFKTISRQLDFQQLPRHLTVTQGLPVASNALGPPGTAACPAPPDVSPRRSLGPPRRALPYPSTQISSFSPEDLPVPSALCLERRLSSLPRDKPVCFRFQLQCRPRPLRPSPPLPQAPPKHLFVLLVTVNVVTTFLIS